MNDLLSQILGKIDLLLGFFMNESATKELLKLAKERQKSDSLAGYWQAIYDAAEISLGIDEEDDPDRVQIQAMKFHRQLSGKRI